MRIGLVLIAALGSMASAAPADRYQRLWQPLASQLAAQCPTKHLDRLSPAELRDSLDAFKAHRPAIERREMDQAERHHCAGSIAGASCANLGTIEVAERHRQLSRIATQLCGQYAQCRGQSDCDAVADKEPASSHERPAS